MHQIHVCVCVPITIPNYNIKRIGNMGIGDFWTVRFIAYFGPISLRATYSHVTHVRTYSIKLFLGDGREVLSLRLPR